MSSSRYMTFRNEDEVMTVKSRVGSGIAPTGVVFTDDEVAPKPNNRTSSFTPEERRAEVNPLFQKFITIRGEK